MRLLHSRLPRRVLDPIAARIELQRLAVELVPLGSGPGDALLAGFSLSADEWRAAEDAGVRWVQVCTVGLEDVLDTPLAESVIPLTTVGGIAVGPIAEFAFARILEHAKGLPLLRERQAEHRWDAVSARGLAGATLAVVGLGPVGLRLAELGKAFAMHVVGVRRRPEAGAGPCDEILGPAHLDEVMSRSDYVVVAAPQTAETVGLIDSSAIASLKPGAFLVNVARGPVVDEDALVAALRDGRVVAALDVFHTEPLPPESPLWDEPGLAVSPHCASITPQLFEDLAAIVVDNVERFLRGEPLRNLIDKQAGYPVTD